MKDYFLEELLQIKNGRDHKHLPNGEIPVYGSGGIMRYGNQAIYNKDSILLPRKGTLSNIQFVNKPFWTVDTIYYTIINKEKANPLYLYYYLKQLDLSYLNSGTGVPSMTFGSYYQVKVNLPSLDIQHKIAKVLSDLDTKIELNNRINSELEAMAKTLYDYWFVQFDFPDGNGKLYKSSGGKMVWNEELKREIPEGWEVKTLLDIATFTNGLACQKFRPNEGEDYYRVIKIREMGSGFTDNSEFVSTNIPPRVVINNGDVLFSWSATLDVKIWTGGKGALNQHIFKVTSKSHARSFYYYELLNYLQHFKMQAELRKTTMGHITQDHLKQSRITIPPQHIIEKLDKIINPILNKKVKLDEENQELASLRDWLLPMLMNGQVRVGDVEKELGMVAESLANYQLSLTDKDKKIRRKMLATYIINQSLKDTSFGKTKFEKLLHLIECHIVKGDYNQRYSVQAAGPYDGGFTKVFWNEVTNAKWFKIEEFGKLKRIMPAENHSKSLADYGYFSDDLKVMINDFIGEFKNTNYERPEIVSTLYAVWNNRIICNEIITDELLKKDFLDWDTQKIRYKDRLDKALEWMRENGIVPDGWGNEIRRAKK